MKIQQTCKNLYVVELIMNEYIHEMRRNLILWLKNHHDVEDFIQEVCIKIFRSRADVEDPKKFVITVANNLRRDWGRNKKRAREKGVEVHVDDIVNYQDNRESLPGPEKHMDDLDKINIVQGFLDELSQREKDAIILAHILGYGQQGVADKHQVSLQQIERDVRYFKQRVKELICI